MDFQAETVSGAMHECVAQPPCREHLPGGRIDQAGLHTGPNHRNRRGMCGTDRGERARKRVACRRQLNRARQIHAVSVVDTSEVQHHAVARGEPTRPGPGMRQGAVGAGGDNRVERRSRKPRLTEEGIDITSNLELRPAGTDGVEHAPGHFRQHARGLPESADLEGILYHTGPLDDSLGRNQPDAGLQVVFPREPRAGRSDARID